MWGEKKNVLLRFIPSPKTYVSEGKEYVYDRCRRKKVVLTPEERVRQSVVSYFRWILRTPLRYMQTEVSMKRYGYTSRKDRADLLILRPDGNTILAVIECKAAHVEISEEVIGQMLRYAKALNTEYAFATNGHDFFAYGFQRKKGYLPVECPGSYREMCLSCENPVPQSQTIGMRSDLHKLNDIKFIRRTYYDYIGGQTRDELLPFIANLCDGLRDISECLKPEEYSGFFLEQDLGIRTMEIVVPGGARFNNNNYRVFKTKDKSGQSFKVGLAVSVYGGEKNEKTMLAVAVDNGKRCHHALQLILDTNTIISSDEAGIYYELTHNGKINVGRRGCAKISEVMEYVKRENPSLASADGRIHFGRIHGDELLFVTSAEFAEVFDRLISYVLILEKFREFKRMDNIPPF